MSLTTEHLGTPATAADFADLMPPVDLRPPINTNVDLDSIPVFLKAQKRWGLWRAVWRINKQGKGRWEKVPVLSTNRPEDWFTFDDAVAQRNRKPGTGLGFCVTGSTDMIAFDLDHCIKEDGELTDWAFDIIERLDSYTEISVGGSGIRVFVRGQYPSDWVTKRGDIAMEVYSGHGGRFLTVTGNVWESLRPVREVSQEDLDDLASVYRVTTGTTASPKTEMPELLEGVEIPPGLPQVIQSFLTEGALGDYDDKSQLVAYTANVLIDAGLDRQQTLSLMAANEYVMDVALDHRRQDDDRALIWLWQHHVCKVKATGPITDADFADDAVESGDKWQVPDLITKTLKWLAKGCEMEVIPFCDAIGFKPKALRHVIDGVVFNQTNSKFVVVTPEGEYRVFTEKNYARGLKLSRGTFYSAGKLDKLLAETAAKLFPDDDKAQMVFISTRGGSIDVALSEHISVERQFGVIEVKVDMFVKEASIRINDGTAIITFPHVPFREGPFDPAVIADFKDHWSMLDEFIDLLVASRFAAARKKAYLWLKAESDWGKGALEAMLSNLGLVVSMSVPEIEKLFSGGPVGRQMNDFKRAWVLLFNEFKTNKSELKMLEQAISFSPKNLPICKVELFLKLFTSAEAVESLVSGDTGVEDQFANRFSLIQPTGNLDARPLFAKSRKRYLDSLTSYVAMELNRKVGEYLELGRDGAADKGDKFVIEFHKKHGIANSFERLSTKIKSLCQDHLDWIEAEYRAAVVRSGNSFGRSLSPVEKAVLDACVVRDEDDGSTGLYVKTAAKILTLWLEVTFNPAERGKLTVKSEAFNAALPEPKTIRPRGVGKPVKGRFVCILTENQELDASDLM